MHKQVHYHTCKCIPSWMIYFVICTRRRNYLTNFKFYVRLRVQFYLFRHPKWSYQLISDNSCPKHDSSRSLLSSEAHWDGFSLNNPTVRSIQCDTTLICEDHLWEVHLHVLFSPKNSFLLISMAYGHSGIIERFILWNSQNFWIPVLGMMELWTNY